MPAILIDHAIGRVIRTSCACAKFYEDDRSVPPGAASPYSGNRHMGLPAVDSIFTTFGSQILTVTRLKATRPLLVSYPDPQSHSCGWITSPLRGRGSGE